MSLKNIALSVPPEVDDAGEINKKEQTSWQWTASYNKFPHPQPSPEPPEH